MLHVGFPPLSEEERDRLVVTRLKRTGILESPLSPVVWALLDEAVLRRPVGGSIVMAEQLRHLIHLMESERVRIHVLPFALGMHPLLQSMLTLMWFEDQPPIAYSEGQRVGRIHDSPEIVEQLRGVYAQGLGDALPQKESLALLRATAKGYEDDE